MKLLSLLAQRLFQKQLAWLHRNLHCLARLYLKDHIFQCFCWVMANMCRCGCLPAANPTDSATPIVTCLLTFSGFCFCLFGFSFWHRGQNMVFDMFHYLISIRLVACLGWREQAVRTVVESVWRESFIWIFPWCVIIYLCFMVLALNPYWCYSCSCAWYRSCVNSPMQGVLSSSPPHLSHRGSVLHLSSAHSLEKEIRVWCGRAFGDSVCLTSAADCDSV